MSQEREELIEILAKAFLKALECEKNETSSEILLDKDSFPSIHCDRRQECKK